jgi:hypothetical protein
LLKKDKTSAGNINLLQNLVTTTASLIEEKKSKIPLQDQQKLDAIIYALNENINAIIKKNRP